MELDQLTKNTIQAEFIQALKNEGLIVVPKDSYNQQMEVKALLKKEYLSPYCIAKSQLIPKVTTVQTVYNMILRGDIHHTEWFYDKKGNYQVITSALKRLRNED